jgi:hypothetical protein
VQIAIALTKAPLEQQNTRVNIYYCILIPKLRRQGKHERQPRAPILHKHTHIHNSYTFQTLRDWGKKKKQKNKNKRPNVPRKRLVLFRPHKVQHIEQFRRRPIALASVVFVRFQREHRCDRVERGLVQEEYRPVLQMFLRTIWKHETCEQPVVTK